MVHHAAALTATTIVAGAAMVVVVVMITAIVARPLAMTTVSEATAVAMTMLLGTLIGMPPLAVKIATAAVVGMIDVAAVTTIERAVARATLPHMVTRRLLGMLAIHTEVESLKPVLTIGSPVDDFRSADLFRFGAPSQVTRSNYQPAQLTFHLHFTTHVYHQNALDLSMIFLLHTRHFVG